MTAPRQNADTTTAILRRKVSWWCDDITKNGGWDGTMLSRSWLTITLTHPQSSFSAILHCKNFTLIRQTTS